MREPPADERELLHQRRRHGGDALHVAAVARMQHASGDLAADLPAVARHLGTLAQQLGGDRELLVHDRRRALLAREIERGLPAGDRHLARDILGELHGLRRAVFHAQQRHGAAEAEEAHAVPALAHDLVALPLERQAVDLDHVVEHAGEDLDDLAVLGPIELGLIGERLTHEAREVHGAEQAGSIGRQRLLAAGIGRADVLAPPVVVHLIDAVDEDEARFGEIIGGGHDAVPHAACRQRFVDPAGDETGLVGDEAAVVGPLAPDELGIVGEIRLLGFELLA